MDLTRKKILIVICFFLFLATCFIVIRVKMEATMMREQRTAYMEVNFAFHLANVERLVRRDMNIEKEGVFRPLPEVDLKVNRFGILTNIYMMLLMYELKTENILTYETVVEYFSREFELDGSLRLHNNGNHPEINAFVVWMLDEYRWQSEFGDFMLNIGVLYNGYALDNQEDGFVRTPPGSLSPQMLRELARATIDPEIYLSGLNLTSLQKAGY
jgi:hypothetical protein